MKITLLVLVLLVILDKSLLYGGTERSGPLIERSNDQVIIIINNVHANRGSIINIFMLLPSMYSLFFSSIT